LAQNKGLRFFTYLIRFTVFAIAFLIFFAIASLFRPLMRPIIEKLVVANVFSRDAGTIISAILMGVFIVAIVFPGIRLIWKLTKKINFENNKKVTFKRYKPKKKAPALRIELDGNKQCLSCGFDRSLGSFECPKCGSIYDKMDKILKRTIEKESEGNLAEKELKPGKKELSYAINVFAINVFQTIKADKPRTVLYSTALVLALMLLFPPFHVFLPNKYNTVEINMGYDFILTPPDYIFYEKVRINWTNADIYKWRYDNDEISYQSYVEVMQRPDSILDEIVHSESRQRETGKRKSKINYILLFIQCLIVTGIGGILWIALKEKGRRKE
jgi:hypothetical protein